MRTRHLMALAAGALELAACGASAPPVDGRTVDLAPRPAEGTLYEILHRETRGFGDETPRVVKTRTLLRVLEVRPDGSRRIRARLFRSLRDSGDEPRLADEVVDFDLSATGNLLGEPERQCGDMGELRLDRYLRHLFGARAIVARAVGEGSEWRADYLSDAIELASPAVFRLDAVDAGEVRGQVDSGVAMTEGDVGAFRVTGEGSVRGRFSVSLADGFSGRADLRTEVRGDVYDRTSEERRRGTLHIRSEILVRPAVDQSAEVVPVDTVFDPQLVVRHIRARLRTVQACYEGLLTDDRALAGRVMVRFTIHPDGRVRDAEAIENTSGNADLAECVLREVRRFRFSPAPACGSVRFAYPFVFAPQT